MGITHTTPKREAESKIDPDDGNSTVCNACFLPIFSTPFVPEDHNNNNLSMLHDQCANDHLPAELKAHPLHPRENLILHQDSTTPSNNNITYKCDRCGSICGSRFYKCRSDCGFKLDLTCALTIKILHRSHHHRLAVIKGKSLLSSFICGACGTQHQLWPRTAGAWLTVYVCIPCDFWIHPECARLPNAILLDDRKHHHPHPLLLSYSGTSYSASKCAICQYNIGSNNVGLGVYACFHCRYSAHIKCVVYSYPHHISFKPVLIRDAQVPNLIRLPMPNEHTGLMKTILANYVGGASSSSNGDHTTTISSPNDHQSDGSKLLENDKIHEHPLIFNDDHHPGAGAARVCNACVQLISPSDPFYSCANNNNNNNELVSSYCRDFFLHRCCALLPTTLTTQHLSHPCSEHPLTLLPKANNRFNMFRCRGCQLQCNGFAYACDKCEDYYLDVVCAFMHTSITHEGHAKSHILGPPQYSHTGMCICCGEDIGLMFERIAYECNSCLNFSLHARCALLPDTITHKFDRHPLKLIITTERPTDGDHLMARGGSDEEKKGEEKIMFCEICENNMDDECWYYGCKECNQCFHVNCIPTLDDLSRIKFGFNSTAHVTCHDCPLACVRALSVDGYRCGHCQRIIRESDRIAFQCSDCYFRIHEDCAKKLLCGNGKN